MNSKDFDALAKMRPPIQKRPRMTMAQALQLYLTIVGWLLWMVLVGYFSLGATDRPLAFNLSFSAFIAVLTFVDLYGLWLAIGRWRALRTPVIALGREESPASEGSVEGGADPGPECAEPGRRDPPEKPRDDVIEAGPFRSLSGDPERLKKQVVWLGVAAVAVAIAILATSLTGWPIFLPGTGMIKGSIALALSLWLFVEPITRAKDEKSRESAIVVKTALVLGLLCFASDHYFPWFGSAGVAAGVIGAGMGRRGPGIYAAFISAAAFALQWWGYTVQ